MQASPWDPESAAAVLDAQGQLAEGAQVEGLDIRAYYKRLVAARSLDVVLGRLGLPVWAPSAGEEAALVGTAEVAEPDEWIYPGARDHAVALVRGMDPEALIGEVVGPSRSAVPGRVADVSLRIATTTDGLGMHLPLAAGHAHATRLGDGGAATFALFGEGLTTTGVFHETVALAVRCDLPLVLVCRSQLWPDEAPPEAGLFGDSVQERATVCGLWSRRVDGADPIAVWASLASAAKRARNGQGPSLVEVVVTPLVRDPPAHRDPVERLRRHLDGLGQWTQTYQDVVEADARHAIDKGLAAHGLSEVPQ